MQVVGQYEKTEWTNQFKNELKLEFVEKLYTTMLDMHKEIEVIKQGIIDLNKKVDKFNSDLLD